MARSQLLSQDWYRVAGLLPRLRAQVEVLLHDYRGTRWYVLHDRSSGKTFRVSGPDYAVLRRFDGNTTVETVWNKLAWTNARDLPPQDEFIDLLAQLFEAGLLRMDGLPRAEQIVRVQRRKFWEAVRKFFASPVSQKIPLYNPSRLLESDFATALAGGLFSLPGLVCFLLLMAAALSTAIDVWEPLTSNLADRALSPDNLLILLLVYPPVKLIHEVAHALAVRRFGGAVREMGAMFLVFVPMPYVDASAANMFRSHGARAMVSGAGILAEFSIGAVAVLLWSAADPGLWRGVLFNVIFICTISTLLFNGNPLLRFDAYYVMADLLQMPNLAGRGQRLMLANVRRLFGLPALPEHETAGQGERSFMIAYAVAAGLYRVFVSITIAFTVAHLVPVVGQALAVWVLVGGVLWPNIRTLWRVLRSPDVTDRLSRFVPRAAAILISGGLALLFLPVPSRTTVTGVIIPAEAAAVHAGVDGLITAIFVSEGEEIVPGDALMQLDPEILVTERVALTARRIAAEVQGRNAILAQSSAFMQAATGEIAAIDASLQEIDRRLGLANVAADRTGAWVRETSLLRIGQYVERGMRLGWVDRPDDRRLVAFLPETVARQLERGLTGVRILVRHAGPMGLSSSRPLDPAALRIQPNSSRTLPDERLADRFGGPVLTEPLDTGQGTYRAISPGLGLEAEGPFADIMVGSHIQLKLSHPPEPIVARYLPEILRRIGETFGQGR